MRVAKIQIRNVLGIEHLEVEPGRLTEIRGKNGQGKTSVLEAIRSVFAGGTDATLLRQGAEEGEVVLVLDDGVEVRKRITPTGSPLTVRHPEMGAVGRPQSFVNAIVDELSFNPVEFLSAAPKRRAEILLEAMPVTLDAAEVEQAVAGLVALPADATEGHGLDALDRVRRAVYDERTAVNREAKSARAAAEQLAAAVAGDDVDPAAVEAEIATLEAEREQIVAEAKRKADAIRESGRTAAETASEKVARLRQELAAAEAEARSITTAVEQDVAVLRAETQEAVSPIDAEIRAKQQARDTAVRAAERAATTREHVAENTARAEGAEARSQALTSALERLDAYRGRLLAALPLSGLEVQDGALVFEGVAFDRLNRAKQVEIALAVAKLRAGKLGLVCVDGLECMDSDTFAAFRTWAAKYDGLQLVVTRVSDGALEVVTDAAA